MTTFADDLQAFTEAGQALIARATEIAALRQRRGKQLGTERLEQLTTISTQLRTLAERLEAVGQPDHASETALLIEIQRYNRITGAA